MSGKQANLFSFFQKSQDEVGLKIPAPVTPVVQRSLQKLKVEEMDSEQPKSIKRRKIMDDDELYEEEDDRPVRKSIPNTGKKLDTSFQTGGKAGKGADGTKGKTDRKTAKLEDEEENANFNGGQMEMSNAPQKKIDAQGNINYDMFDDPTPWWAQKENRLDAHKRKPTDPLYDATTLYVPEDERKKLTPARRQFWDIKKSNMDKVIFFKLGKFYELFDEDAVLGVQVLGLAFMGNTMHAGVPEMALDKFADKLVQLGYKVAIVEQTETERERKTRLSTSAAKTQEKCINREMIKVLTKGTYVCPIEDTPKLNSNYIWVFRSFGDGYGLCISELSLNMCWVTHIASDDNYSKLKMMIYQLKPSEIVVDPMHLNRDTQKIFSHISSNPLITKIGNASKIGFWNDMKVAEVFKDHKFIKNLEQVASQFSSEESKNVVRSVFAGFVNYLNQLKILENHIDILSIRKYDEGTSLQQRMVLDSQALEQLEIIEATHDFRSKRDDSLLHCLDRCISQPGKRLMKSMICSPFMDIKTINQRLDAIEDLNKHPHFLKDFRGYLGKSGVGDLERILARLFKYSIKQKERFVMFEDVSTTRLRELRNVFSNLLGLQELLLNSQLTCRWSSSLIKSLTSLEEDGGLLNKNLKEEVEEIQASILWTGEKRDIPVPREKVNPEYDAVKDKIKEVHRELDVYLLEQKKALNCPTLEFAHSKIRYEISVPENMKVPPEYAFSSAKKGSKRYTTPTAIRLVDKLEGREDQLKEHMKDFALYIFEYFNQKRDLWENLVNISRELDVLCSLSLYSFTSRGDFCRPKLYGEDSPSFIDFKQSRHPIVSQLQEDFVPNDIRIGARSDDQVILLTGPNMGGKSTILRQACLVAIIAQLGCYVPAESCEMTTIDRIFTRLGASDKLVEGKSTFFIEMEDIYNLVSYGSSRSLAIIDELGRGTSTADGYAIAAAILDHMVSQLRCLSIFSTHYHSLINFCLDYDAISFWKMDYMIDDGTQDIIFLYKLAEGICNRSFGIKIGRLAGIEESILSRAEEVSREIDLNVNRNFREEIDRKYGIIEDAMTSGKDLTTLRL